MKYADKLHAKFSCIIGDNELAEGSVKIKRMDSGESETVFLDPNDLTRYIYGETLSDLNEFTDGTMGSVLRY